MVMLLMMMVMVGRSRRREEEKGDNDIADEVLLFLLWDLCCQNILNIVPILFIGWQSCTFTHVVRLQTTDMFCG